MRILSIILIVFCLLAGAFTTVRPAAAQTETPTAAPPPLRIGLMGDSTIDEYRANDNRGGKFASTTFNWLELLVRYRNVSAGTWGKYDEPRRTGYEYNWARSAATAETLLTQGQPQGLAAQVKAGDIDLVIMDVGDHDFAPYNTAAYEPIYSGTMTDDQLTRKINTIVTDETTAVDTILAAGKIPMIVTTIVDFNLAPDPDHPDATRRQRVSDAIARANEGIKAMAEARGIGVMDLAEFSKTSLVSVQDGMVNVGGIQINAFTSGDDPHNARLGDGIHAGTVLEGLITNGYLNVINQYVNPQIPLFTDQEILNIAGLPSS